MFFLKWLFRFFLLLFLGLPISATVWGTTSIVVQPVHNGSSDEVSDKTADILREKLAATKFFSVVDPKKVGEVLSYYKNFQQSSGTPLDDDIKNLLNQAKEHYFHFAYNDAAAELKKIADIFEKNPQLFLKEGQVLLDSWIVFALVQTAQKKNAEAVEAFEKVLHLDPFYTLDPKNFSPSLHKIFAEAQRDMAKEPNGNIEIASDPKVADVYLNGVYQGVAPLKLAALPAGNYFLRFEGNHYQTVDKVVSVDANRTVTLHPKLHWSGTSEKNTKKKPPVADRNRKQIEEGLRIAGLLKTDKVLMVDVDDDFIHARLLDRRFRTSHIPVSIALKGKGSGEALQKNLDNLVSIVVAQSELNLLKNPETHLDPEGIGDPILLKPPHKKISKGFLYGGLGTLMVGGALAGFFLASGGSGTPATGSLAINFK